MTQGLPWAQEALRHEFEVAAYPYWGVAHYMAATAIAPFLLSCFAGFPLPCGARLLTLLRVWTAVGIFDLQAQFVQVRCY